jgi:hypothetical protein
MVVKTVEVGAVMKMKITVTKKLVDPVLSALKKIEETKEEAKIMQTIS